MLDLLLSNYEFQTEASSLYLQDLDLSIEYKNLVQSHEEFFVNQARIEQLKSILEKDDTESKIRLKMLSVICNCDPEWEKVLYSLFSEAIKSKSDKYKSIEKFNLSSFIWEVAERKYNYKSASPTIKDLILQLFKDNFDRSVFGAVNRLQSRGTQIVEAFPRRAESPGRHLVRAGGGGRSCGRRLGGSRRCCRSDNPHRTVKFSCCLFRCCRFCCCGCLFG
jgi:hypothetical protein